MQPFHDPAVKAVFDACPPQLRPLMLALRQRIFSVAAGDPAIGPLLETLKWGQPSYLTPTSKSGSTLRLGPLRGEAGACALFVNCRTTLIDGYRQRYGHLLRFEGTRAVVFRAADRLPKDIVDHCVHLALTYHLNKRRDGLPF